MNFLTVSHFYRHILENKDMCAQFLRECDLHIIKVTENCNETQTIKELWKQVKNKYGMKSSKRCQIQKLANILQIDITFNKFISKVFGKSVKER